MPPPSPFGAAPPGAMPPPGPWRPTRTRRNLQAGPAEALGGPPGLPQALLKNLAAGGVSQALMEATGGGHPGPQARGARLWACRPWKAS